MACRSGPHHGPRGSRAGACTTADTTGTDWARMLERLADPALMDAAVAVAVGETACGVQYGLAVPVGGYRLGGYLTVTNHAAALAAMSALEGRPGFPSVRVRRAVTAPWASRTSSGERTRPRATSVSSGDISATPTRPSPGTKNGRWRPSPSKDRPSGHSVFSTR